MQALLESALHAPPPSTLLHAAAPPSPLPALLVSPTLVLQQHPSALDALFQVLQSATALNAAQITRILAFLAQVVGLLLPVPHVSPCQVAVSPAASLVPLQLLPHALNATQDLFQMLPLLQHAQLLELLPTAFSTLGVQPLPLLVSSAPYATQVTLSPLLLPLA